MTKKQRNQSSEDSIDSLPEELLKDSEFAASAERDVVLLRMKQGLQAQKERYDNAVRKVDELEKELEAFRSLAAAPLAHKKIKTPKAEKGTAAAAIVINDQHCAEKIDPSVLEYPNYHDLDVYRARCERTAQKALKLYHVYKDTCDINEFQVWVLGDLMANYLHEENVETNTIGPTEEMLEVRRQLHSLVQFLRHETSVPKMSVHTVHGNHSRMTKQRRYKAQHATNLEWFLCEDLARQYMEANDPVTWHVSRARFTHTTIKGWTVRLHHGDDIRYEGGIGGLTIPLLKAVKAWNENSKTDYTFVAHWHQFLRLWNIVVCGCQIGFNEFAQGCKIQAQPPSQTFAVFDAEKGMVFCDPLLV